MTLALAPFDKLRANGGRLRANGFFPFGSERTASFPFGLSLSKPCCKTLVLPPFGRLRANGIGA
jgi:hypothetical protein